MGRVLRSAAEAATRKHTVSMPKAYEKIGIRAEGSTSRLVAGRLRWMRVNPPRG